MFEPLEHIQWFLQAGGWVLWGILALTVLLATMLAERFWFFLYIQPQFSKDLIGRWNSRADQQSLRSQLIRHAWLSSMSADMQQGLGLIRLLVALCPLLGLLGTVTGMIQVFEVLAVTGTGNARAMAEGVGRATVPTMAGMLVALIGLYGSNRLEKWVRLRQQRLAENLVIESSRNV